MELANDGFCFSEGQVYFWETYLKRHPEREAEIKKLLKEGKLEFLMQGLLVCDTNYAPAEGIIRNFLLAEPFYQRMAGKEHSRQGFVWDAFGSSANLPEFLISGMAQEAISTLSCAWCGGGNRRSRVGA